MKKFIFSIFFSLFTFHFSLAQWVDMGSHFPDTINSACLPGMFCIGDTCWIVSCSFDNILYYSTDGCQTITAKSVPDRANAVWFLNYHLGYIATQGGHVYKSTDGGDTWTFHGIGGSALYDITFPPNATTGWTCGYWGHLHKVTPSGVSPNIDCGIGTTNLWSVSFPDSTHGWMCGENVIVHYYNDTWHTDQTYSYGSWSDLFFLNDTLGWAAGDFMGGGNLGSGLMRTNDGINWSDQNNPAEQDMFAILFINEDEGWAGSVGGKLVHTTDGGNSWLLDEMATTISNHRFIRKIFYVPSKQALYVLGNKGLLLKKSSVNGIAPKEVNDKISFSIYPNPFAGSTVISWQSAVGSRQLVVIKVFDFMGKEISTLVDGEMAPGEHHVTFDSSGLPAGVYFCHLESRGESVTKKLLLIK